MASATRPSIAGARRFRRGIHSIDIASKAAIHPNAIPPAVPSGGIPTRGWTSACGGVVFTVSVTWPLPVIELGFTKQAASVSEFGSEQVKLMGAVKFEEPATVIVEVPDWPGCEIVVVVALSVKSSTAIASASDTDSV